MLSMPAPPHSEGTATPASPSSKAFRTASRGYECSRSHFFALGLSSRSANSRHVSRSSLCSSMSSISMVQLSRLKASGWRVYTDRCGGPTVASHASLPPVCDRARTLPSYKKLRLFSSRPGSPGRSPLVPNVLPSQNSSVSNQSSQVLRLALGEQVAGDDHALNLRSSFVNLQQLGVAHQLLDRILFRI